MSQCPYLNPHPPLRLSAMLGTVYRAGSSLRAGASSSLLSPLRASMWAGHKRENDDSDKQGHHSYWEIIRCKKMRHLKQGASGDVPTKVPWGLQGRGLQGPRRPGSLAPSHSDCSSLQSCGVAAACSHPLTRSHQWGSAPDTAAEASHCRRGDVCSSLEFPGARTAAGTQRIARAWAQHGGTNAYSQRYTMDTSQSPETTAPPPAPTLTLSPCFGTAPTPCTVALGSGSGTGV